MHGFARVIPWHLVDADTLKNGVTRLTLQMMETAESRRQLSYPYALCLTITVGETLRLEENFIFEGVKAYECSGTPADCVKIARCVTLRVCNPLVRM